MASDPPEGAPDAARGIRLFLAGDVMTGRGIDQILPTPSDPRLHEPWVQDAREYVRLAEEAHGPVPRPAEPSYVWGEALGELARLRPVARIVNLETAVTTSEAAWPDKGIHYRMHPDNVDCLTAAGLDCCCLANNHVLDWGVEGLLETLETLHDAGIRTCGAGREPRQARQPALLELSRRARLLVFAFALRDSGIPPGWRADVDRPGIEMVEEPLSAAVERIASRVAEHRRVGDLVIVSLHWGPNWGFRIEPMHRELAHRLIDDVGADLVHGHSSHHVKGIEVWEGKLILYGCGDLLTDYEGIPGREEYRGELGLLYFPALDARGGELRELRMTPTRMRRLQVTRAGAEETRWLRDTLNREGQPFGTTVEMMEEGRLRLRW